MEDKSLLRLIKKARLGDKESFRKLVEAKGRKIVFVAVNLMGNKADGEDAAQEAVITLAKKIGTLKKAELFDAWMYRIIYNVCIDEKRKKSRKLDTSGELEAAIATVAEQSSEVIPEQKMEEAANKEEIMAAISKLPERHRMVLLLYYYEDMTYNQIAETLQLSEQVVANTLNRAKEKLRTSLRKEDFPSFGIADSTSDEAFSGGIGLPVASKAGTMLPALAIAQAFAFSEAATVTAGSVSNVASAAASVVMPKGLILARLADSVLAKSVAGILCAAALVGGIVYGISGTNIQPPTHTPPAPIEEKPRPVEEPKPPTAKVTGLPEGAKATIITEGVDGAALGEFKAALASFTLVTALDSDGYRFALYCNNNDPTDYILSIEKL